jgi:hypothetical protein
VGGGMEEIYCLNTRTIYVIHSPTQWESAVQLEQMIRERIRELSEYLGIDIEDVYRINTGDEGDLRILERIMNDESCFEVEI